MSGFITVLAREGERVDETVFATLAATLTEYGPDGSATRHDGPVALVHALFSARENSSIGPHRSARGSWLVGDIRVDAQNDLRELLAAAGAPIAYDASDEALFLAAWDAWGTDALSKVRGDFSAVVWDPARRVLCAARDAFGVRPLYYAFVNGQFVCSNVLAAVRAMPGISSRLHEPAIVSFLQWGYNVDLTTTTFADIQRLAPAHHLLLRAGDANGVPHRHWSFPEPRPLVYRREQEYIDHYLQVMGEAVSDRLRQPGVALLFSGGLDSTAIAATACRVSPSTALHAYTWVTTPVRPDDEGRVAELAARHLGIRHEIIGDPLPSLSHLGFRGFRSPEPLDGPDEFYWLTLAPKIARESRVLLVGEDGDALFLPPSIRKQLRSWPLGDVLARAMGYTLSTGHFPHTGLRWREKLRGGPPLAVPPAPAWLRADVLARTGEQRDAPVSEHPTRPETRAALDVSLWQAMFAEYDRALTRVPVETRWPMLDTRLLEFVLAIPPIPWCQRKTLVRRAFRGALPDAVLRRPKTPVGGFTEAQIARWRSTQPTFAPGFDMRMEAYVDTAKMRKELVAPSTENTLAVWRAIELDQWLSQL